MNEQNLSDRRKLHQRLGNPKKPHCMNPRFCEDQTFTGKCNKPITRNRCPFQFKGRGYKVRRNQSLRGRPASSGDLELEQPLEVVEEAIQ